MKYTAEEYAAVAAFWKDARGPTGSIIASALRIASRGGDVETVIRKWAKLNHVEVSPTLARAILHHLHGEE